MDRGLEKIPGVTFLADRAKFFGRYLIDNLDSPQLAHRLMDEEEERNIHNAEVVIEVAIVLDEQEEITRQNHEIRSILLKGLARRLERGPVDEQWYLRYKQLCEHVPLDRLEEDYWLSTEEAQRLRQYQALLE